MRQTERTRAAWSVVNRQAKVVGSKFEVWKTIASHSRGIARNAGTEVETSVPSLQLQGWVAPRSTGPYGSRGASLRVVLNESVVAGQP
mgnify:CR=1 FL=1